MLELWGIPRNHSLTLLPGSIWLRVAVHDKGPIYGSKGAKIRTYAKLNFLK